MRLITSTLVALSCLVYSGTAQEATVTNVPARALSLEESVRLALEHNLGIRIIRHDPRIVRFSLEADYSYYEPTLSASAGHSFSTSEPVIDFVTGLPSAPGERTSDSGSTGIRGVTPWGLRYDVGADVSFLTSTIESAGGVTAYNRSYNIDTGIILAQPLLRGFWIDAGRATIELNKRTLRIAEHTLALQVMQTLRAVEQAYFDLIAAQDQVKVQEKAVELADRLLSENKTRVKVGTMAPLEEKQAESQAATTRADLIGAQARLGTAERVLKNLITDNYEEWFAVRVQPTQRLMAIREDFNLQASWLQGLTLRPDFLRAKEEVERQGIEVSFRKNAVYPSLDLVGSYGRAGIDSKSPITGAKGTISPALADIRDNNLPHYSYGLQFSFPLGNRDARYRLRAAKERMSQLEDSLKQVHQTVIVEIDNAIGVAQSAFERVSATRAASEYAEAALSAEEKKYENGRSTSFQVLRVQRDLTQARADEITALADYNKALSDFYYREGTTLEKNRVVIK